MNRLFYVAMYNPRRNEYARKLTTAADEDGAVAECRASLPDEWRVRDVRLICETNEQVWTEL